MSGTEHQRCPRRDEHPDAFGDGTTTPDSWPVRDEAHSFAGSGGMRACSYCGSMHPDDLMKAIAEDGWTLGPTDKNYKVYVQELPDEPIERVMERREARARGESVETPPSGRHHKFYFQHLSEPQKMQFIVMLNAGTLKVGFPGHFYALPFFIGRRTKEP